jgi:hypothetical protein
LEGLDSGVPAVSVQQLDLHPRPARLNHRIVIAVADRAHLTGNLQGIRWGDVRPWADGCWRHGSGIAVSGTYGSPPGQPAEALFGSSSAVLRPTRGERPSLEGLTRHRTCSDECLVPLAGLEPATCCLGDNCQSSAQTGPVGSRQLRLARHSVECGLVGCSRAWWNDCENDHQSKLAWVQEGEDGANLKAGWGGVRSGVASR